MALAARAYAPRPATRRARAGKRARKVRFRTAGKGLSKIALLAIPLSLILVYVSLTAQLTAQTYRIHDAQARQVQLLQENNELRQQVARLESLPRLEAAAAKLHMTVPSSVALIAPAPASRALRPATAFEASIASVMRWFNVR
jgi:cell division protein FtsB